MPALQAVVGTDGEVQVLNLLVELGVVLLGARRENRLVLLGLVDVREAHEGRHVLVDDVGGLDDRVARADGAIGLDLEQQAVVVGVATNAARLDGLGAAAHGRVERIHVDDADGVALALVVVTRDVTATNANAHLHREVRVGAEGADDVVGVHERELRRDVKVPTGDRHGAVDVDGGDGLIAGTHGAETRGLHVEDDIGDVLVTPGCW